MKIMQQTQKWGNSTGIRIPKKVLTAAKWQHNQEVQIDVEGNKIVLKPIEQKESNHQSLKNLVDGMTPENRHQEVDWGEPTGKEIW